MTLSQNNYAKRETLQEVIDRTLIEDSKTDKTFRKRVRHYKNFQMLCNYRIPPLRTIRYLNATTRCRADKSWIKYLEEVESYHGGETEDSVCNGLYNALEHHYGQSLWEYFQDNLKLLLSGLTRRRMKEAHTRIRTRRMTEEEYQKLKRLFPDKPK